MGEIEGSATGVQNTYIGGRDCFSSKRVMLKKRAKVSSTVSLNEDTNTISPVSPRVQGKFGKICLASVSPREEKRSQYSFLKGGSTSLAEAWRVGVREVASRLKEEDADEILLKLKGEHLLTYNDFAQELARLTQSSKSEIFFRKNGNLDENRKAALARYPRLKFLEDSQLRHFLAPNTYGLSSSEAVRRLTQIAGGLEKSILATLSGGVIEKLRIEDDFVVAVIGTGEGVLVLSQPLSTQEFQQGRVLWLMALFEQIEQSVRNQVTCAHDDLDSSSGDVASLIRGHFQERLCLQAILTALNLHLWDTIWKEAGTDDVRTIFSEARLSDEFLNAQIDRLLAQARVVLSQADTTAGVGKARRKSCLTVMLALFDVIHTRNKMMRNKMIQNVRSSNKMIQNIRRRACLTDTAAASSPSAKAGGKRLQARVSGGRARPLRRRQMRWPSWRVR